MARRSYRLEQIINKLRGGAGRGQNKVRTFWENVVDEIEIPIYDIPLQQRVRTH